MAASALAAEVRPVLLGHIMRKLLIASMALWAIQSPAKFSEEHPNLHRLALDCGTALMAVSVAFLARPWFMGEEKPSQFPPDAVVSALDPIAVQHGIATFHKARTLIPGRIYAVYFEGVGGHFERAIATEDGARLEGIPLTNGYETTGESLFFHGPNAQRTYRLEITQNAFRWYRVEDESHFTDLGR